MSRYFAEIRISDSQVSSFLKTIPGCRVSRRQNVLRTFGYRAIKAAYSIFDGQLKIDINFKKYNVHDSGYLLSFSNNRAREVFKLEIL